MKTNTVGYDAAAASDLWNKDVTAMLTNSVGHTSIVGQFDHVWISCPTLANNAVTITMTACPADR